MNDVTKDSKLGVLTVRELKAAALDARVKQEIASQHASMLADMARLKALRLARDAAAHQIVPTKQKRASPSAHARSSPLGAADLHSKIRA